MSPRYPKVTVKLIGEDGNAFAIMGRVDAALKEGQRQRGGEGGVLLALYGRGTAGPILRQAHHGMATATYKYCGPFE
jgi:hypothetical protein